ncbi:unnamed protein product, partial [Onchocerca flexuosa]|uniref:UTP--glucose-1-phosphate uridylyltransferase n=1 Tax=Onchocerca flexuosa TaxID=387005 RepID=A0A183H0I2_9BILA
VAYKVRFENTTSSETKIVYGTDGIFLRETFYDSLLTHYSVIIVDEAHERSVHTDIVVMSATLETNVFSEYFDNAPVYIVQGRTYPVEIFYANSLDKKDDDYVFNVLATVLQIHRTEPLSSDVLAFLTGQEEIETACKKVQEASRLLTGGLVVLPLYAGLPPSAQMRIFEPCTRKIIFATNIAETSITIPGVRIIVDSGKIKVKTFLPDRHIDILRVESISQCSATQRAGRAGREAPGKCYRLYSEQHFHSLSKVTVPEILRSNLAVVKFIEKYFSELRGQFLLLSVLLELLRIGLRRTKSLALISNPKKEGLEAAEQHLRLLDAVKGPDKKGRLRLTEMGTKLSSFPVDPAFARALIAASQNDCLEEVLTIVAFMSTDSVFVSSAMNREQTNLSRRKFEAPEGDHCTLLNVYRGYRLARKEKKLEEWCEANHVHQRILNTVFKIRKQLRDICSKNSLIFRSCGADTNKLRKTLCQGLFMNACAYERSQDRYSLLISPETSLKIHPSSCLSRSRPTAFIFTDLVRTNELYARLLNFWWGGFCASFHSKKLNSHNTFMTSREMNKSWNDEAQKLFKNVGEQFKQIFVNDERTQFDTEVFLSLFEQYLSEPNTVDWSKIKPLSLKFQQNYDSLPQCSERENRDEILKHLSVVKLNGGLGTTMGCNGPKSLIELRSGFKFLDFAIGHVQHFNEQNNSSVPLILMNSFNTDKAICEYLADRKINVKTFMQSKCPRIFAKSSVPVPLKDGGENIEGWYPPGHGNIFKSMHFTGVLDELLAQGRDICFISNIDNTGATIDLRIAKLMVESDLEYVMECIEKTEIDKKGGTLVEINGYIMHLEMPQVPKDHINDFCSTDNFNKFLFFQNLGEFLNRNFKKFQDFQYQQYLGQFAERKKETRSNEDGNYCQQKGLSDFFSLLLHYFGIPMFRDFVNFYLILGQTIHFVYLCYDRWALLGLEKFKQKIRKDDHELFLWFFQVLSNGVFVNQLETSLGGAIRNFDKILSIQVSRSRFLPVKNTQELFALMSDLYEVTEDFSLRFIRKDKAPIIELSEHFNKISEFRKRFCEIPRLRELKRLKVEGDIYFGHDVILKGNVEIIADQRQQLKVADGECLENIKLIQTAQHEFKRIPL